MHSWQVLLWTERGRAASGEARAQQSTRLVLRCGKTVGRRRPQGYIYSQFEPQNDSVTAASGSTRTLSQEGTDGFRSSARLHAFTSSHETIQSIQRLT